MSDTPHFCPCCGYNLTVDKPIVQGLWRLTPNLAQFNGEKVDITAQEAAVLYTIAAANGQPVRAATIGERVGIDAVDVGNLAAVYICKIRRKLKPLNPIATYRGAGYYWDGGR